MRAALVNLEAGEIRQVPRPHPAGDRLRARLQDRASRTGRRRDVAPGERRAVDPYAADEEEPTEGETDVCQPPEPNNSTDIQDKIRENILAMQVTAEYPGREGKERILETYLNLIYYGNGSYGIKAAAANYFGLTNLADMTISQAAFLAALPQAPSYLDPYQNPNSTLENPEDGAGALLERNLSGCDAEEGKSRPPRRPRLGPPRG